MDPSIFQRTVVRWRLHPDQGNTAVASRTRTYCNVFDIAWQARLGDQGNRIRRGRSSAVPSLREQT
jgi:hypothetical protein